MFCDFLTGKLMKQIVLRLSILLCFFNKSYGQVTMSGPACTMLNQTYTYSASGWTMSTSMQWDVNGGIITTGSCNCLSKTGTPLPSITVKWTSLSTGNWVKLTTTNPSNVVLVNVSTVSALVPGTISNPSQNKNYNSIPGDFTC